MIRSKSRYCKIFLPFSWTYCDCLIIFIKHGWCWLHYEWLVFTWSFTLERNHIEVKNHICAFELNHIKALFVLIRVNKAIRRAVIVKRLSIMDNYYNRTRRSVIWDHVIYVDGKVICKYCNRSWSNLGGLTSTPLKHIIDMHFSDLTVEQRQRMSRHSETRK